MPGADLLVQAREAIERHAWGDAQRSFAEAHAKGSMLTAADLEAMADASWWVGQMREAIAFRERAHSSFRQAGDRPSAARVALRLVEHHVDMGEISIATAWLARGEEMLRDHDEVPEHAQLRLMQALVALQTGALQAALELTSDAIEIARRQGDKDMLALGLASNGVCTVLGGDVAEGMLRLEEATVAAVSGELGALATGIVYCMMISASSELADWQRAGEWSEAATRWCERQSINGFPGVCRVHRAEVMKLRGSLSEAEDEARAAVTELGGFNVRFAALAFRELGDIRLRIGDLDAAEEAFRQANEMGVMPLPGLALAQIERGKPQAAFNTLRRALAEEMPPTERAKLLPTFVHAALLIDDTATARDAASELATIAQTYSSPALRAHAHAAAAAVALADGELSEAATSARLARKLFQEIDLQFSLADATALLGRTYQADGDPDAAEFEYLAALARFEKLGAMPAAARARALLDSLTPAPEASGRRVAKTFLFSDIVKSTDLVGVIGDEAWMDLLGWHDEALRTAFAAHGGEEITHTGDGFFVSFESPDAAIDAAMAIQRSLAEHRRKHGFAPSVRLGLHATEASEVRGNYHGKGVHEAARIAALAGAGEIIASRSTLDLASSTLPVGDVQMVALKGVSEPVEVVQIRWN